MKKLSIFLLLWACISGHVFAQSSYGAVTFTLVTAPCDTNGILVAHISSGSIPFSVVWDGGTMAPGGAVTHTGVMSYTDTLFHYTGSPVWVNVLSGTTYEDTGSYAGMPPFNFAFAPTPTFCGTEGVASVTVTGGVPPYTYQWYKFSDGVTYGYTNPIMLPAGSAYGVNITDAAGCAYGSSYSPPYSSAWDSIMNTPTFSLTVDTTEANCTNGSARVHVSGGTAVPPLSYLWSNGATADSIIGLTMGLYLVTVVDSTGCAATGYANILQSPFDTVTIHVTTTPATCTGSDGSAIAFGSGGITPYTYLWGTGATTQSVTGLAGGSYEVSTADARGCIATGYFFISSYSPITVTYSTTPSSCGAPTGTASLHIVGGTPPYTDTFYSSPIQTDTTATGLAPGDYFFRVVDATGCVQTGIVTVPPIDVMTTTFTDSPAYCTSSTGSIFLTVTGGVPPLSYLWSTGATTSSLVGVSSGIYYVLVTDANGCTKYCYDDLFAIEPISLNFASVPASCLYDSDAVDVVYPSGGTPPYHYNWWYPADTTNVLTGIPTGTYTVTVTDTLGCVKWATNYVGYNIYDSSCFCLVKGRVYHDLDSNCIYASPDPELIHKRMELSPLGYSWTNDSGLYYFLVPSGDFILSETIDSYYPLSPCQPNFIPITVSAGTGCVMEYDFGNTIDTIHSLRIATWSYDSAVVGETYYNQFVITNQGTVTESNVLAGYKTDGQLGPATFYPAGYFVPDSAKWYSTIGGSGLSLAPGVSQEFTVTYLVPTTVPASTPCVIKDSVTWQVPMSNWLADYSPWNNVNYYNLNTGAPHDPNGKEVNPTGYGPQGIITWADSNLQYVVHFQNDGTAPAHNVIVIDSLDPHLNIASFQPAYESAQCHITMSDAGVVKFEFDDINLPANGPYTAGASNGMLTYDIKLNPGLPIGTQIRNKAAIYFDFNPPIVTNTTLNTIGWPLSATSVIANQGDFFTIYPNPTSGSYNIALYSEVAGAAKMTLSDITGRVLTTRDLNLSVGSQTIESSTPQLTSGVYLVNISSGTHNQTQKLVIAK